MSIKSGKIISLIGGNYYTKVENKIIKARARGLFRHQDIKPVVGDEVKIEILDHDEGYILQILERKNLLARPAIANIDQALILSSFMQPEYSYNLLDKFLAIIEFYNIEPIIVVSKIDLADSIEQVKQAYIDYEKSGYQVVYTSIYNDQSTNLLKDLLKDKVNVLVGQSGSGKSSLLNSIDKDFNIKTNEISKALGRGKHTTRHVEIYETNIGYIADSPGFSSLNLDMLDANQLAISYHDFYQASKQCKFSNCLHFHEPSCHVKYLVQQKEIPQSRYDNYLLFLDEIKQRKVKY